MKKRQFKVSVEGMLRVEEERPIQPSGVLKKQTYPWATLDDVPAFALSTLSQLYNTLIKPFERSYGTVIYGPSSHVCGPDCGSWGRSVLLHTGEKLQLKFSPRTMLEDEHAGIALISVKMTNSTGLSSVRTAILFAPELEIPPGVDSMRRSCALLGPRGTHLLLISFFKQHTPSIKPNQLSTASWTINPHGCGSVRSTTFSVTNVLAKKGGKKGKRADQQSTSNAYKNFDHSTANLVAPGTSGMLIAAEISNCDMPDSERRPSAPIHVNEWQRLMETATNGVLEDDAEIGQSAIAASVAITELLSGEGIISMLSNEFFHGALPDNLHNPLGMGLIICMAVRIAMVPGLHGLKNSAIVDQVASAEIRSIFEAQMHEIPFLNRMYAIDVALNMAKKNTSTTRASNSNFNAKTLVDDQLNYWHRAGQSIVTSLYGPGTSLDRPLKSRFGTPWRYHDPLLAARDTKAIDLGVSVHHIRDGARINLATISVRRVQLMRLLVEVEKYLRNGVFIETRMMPPNDDALAGEQMVNNHVRLQELILPQVQKHFEEGKNCDFSSQRQMQDELYKCYNMAAVAQATLDMTEALTAGPVVHFKHKIGAYLVADSQSSPCCDCNRSVHVLQGIMLMHGAGECVVCHAKRCLACSAKYGHPPLTADSKPWSVQCLRCGSDPARDHPRNK